MSSPRADVARIPLHLVTGFLGSGKTTLINGLLRNPSFSGTMVVVNEFGEVGLDHLLVTDSHDRVVLLDSGCLCCAASGTLRESLLDLFSGVQGGRVPPFDRIIVETSGLADPAPLVAGLLGDSALETRCRLQQVVTLVDAIHAGDDIPRYPEARRQVALADLLLVTKLGEPGAATLPQVQAQLQDAGAHAPVEALGIGDDVAGHFAAGPIDRPETTRPAMLEGGLLRRGPLRRQYGGEGREAPDHGAARAAIASRSWRVPEPIDWPTYAAWSATMRARFGKRLLRCKGLIAVGPPEEPWVFQAVHGYFAKPERLPAWPSGEREGFVVCICESIDARELEDAMEALRPGISSTERRAFT